LCPEISLLAAGSPETMCNAHRVCQLAESEVLAVTGGTWQNKEKLKGSSKIECF